MLQQSNISEANPLGEMTLLYPVTHPLVAEGPHLPEACLPPDYRCRANPIETSRLLGYLDVFLLGISLFR